MDDQRSETLAPQGRAEEGRAPEGRAPEGRAKDDGPVHRDAGHLVAEPRHAGPTPSRRRSKLRLILWLLVAAAVVIAAVVVVPRLHRQPSRGGRAVSGGPVPVGTTTVQQGDMPVTLTGLGTVTPLATVTVKTQINGYLMSVAFQEGQRVKKGDFLAQIDPRPYQVALEQAEGQLGKDQALLNNARVDLQRYNTLVAQNSIARQTRDTQVSLVAQDQAAIVSDKAQLDAQKLNLTYCHIISPVTGRVGLRQVDAGNYVQTSDPNGIVVVTQLQPISAIFTLPEDNLPQVLQQWHAGASLQAVAYDRSNTIKLDTGKLDTIDNEIDTATGTVKLRAIFNNPNEILFPNQFVNVQLLVETLKGVDLVPSAAIQRGAPGTFVYLVKPNRTVAVQKVKLGPTDGERVVVMSGLQPGQMVVDDGADRLKDGAKVTIAAPAAGPAGPSAAAGAAGGAARTGTSPPGLTGLTTPAGVHRARQRLHQPAAGQ
ncbi:MAG TPA: MdtA/MuxA family multidrug efflux RND transporter periplasmic adaptor subunit [Stellaceae bacterium]|jgi:multidrug efflux system membrane fusion protein